MSRIKRFLKAAVCLLILLTAGVGAFAEEYTGAVTPEAVLLCDADSGEILFEKAPNARVYPASTTKILTALVVLERTEDIHAPVTVDSAALSGIYEGDDSTLEPMLKAGEQLTVEQLLYGLLLVSGNDCASALAYHVAGGTTEFAALMNEKAAALGMENSHFANPHGVQDDSHYTTAHDMALLAAAALDEPAFMQIVSTAEYRLPATNLCGERRLVTSNRFLREKDDMPGTACPWVTGMKTGYTPAAGGCLVTSAERDGRRLLCLVYGDGSPEQRDRWFLTKALLRYGFGPEEAGEETPVEEALAVTERAPSAAGRIVSLIGGVLLALLALFFLVIAALQVRRVYLRARRGRATKGGMRAALATLAIGLALVVPMALCFRHAGKVKTEIEAYRRAEEARAAALAQAEAKPVFDPQAGESADPALWGVSWRVIADGRTVSDYRRETSISFDAGEEYFVLPGVASFRGNNYRNGGSYGTADIRDETIDTLWSVQTGSLAGSMSGAWSGSGWTGQPLIAQWDADTRAVMNLYDAKKDKDGLVEVIYATLDGHVYFLDLDDGSYTRDPLDLGMPFKGAGSLDPRGWPILYVGSGDETEDGRRPRMFIVSLIDGSVLYENGYDDPNSLRMDNDRWCAFDSSPLVDADTDTLIWPGESGVLYTIRLHTAYDRAAGTLSIAPDEPVRTVYDTSRSGVDRYWYGYESSAVIVARCLYISENGGMFFCVDLDTMALLWAQDTRDDSNSTPVYEPDGEAHGYLYTAPSLHWTADGAMSGGISVYKLDAITGEIVWSRSYDCRTVDGVSGGVQSSPVLGRKGSEIDGLVIYGISRTPDINSGLLVALDTLTGSEVWRLPMDDYAWSSPVALYNDAGSAWLVLCDSAGRAFLIDASTGHVCDDTSLGANVEATPAAFNDTLIVGSRGQRIYAMGVS